MIPAPGRAATSLLSPATHETGELATRKKRSRASPSGPTESAQRVIAARVCASVKARGTATYVEVADDCVTDMLGPSLAGVPEAETNIRRCVHPRCFPTQPAALKVVAVARDSQARL